MAKQAVEVEGAKELRKAIKQMQDVGLVNELKGANKDVAELVAEEARRLVPVRSGALKKSIRALGSQTSGQVAVGRGKTRVYAPIIHFGNPKRGIRPTPFLYEARDKRTGDVIAAYEKFLNEMTKKVSSQ